MQIIVIGNYRGGWDTSINDEEHIAAALEESGNIVYRWQRDENFTPVENVDLIIIAQWNEYPEDFVSNLRNQYSGAVIVYWAFDYQSAPRQSWHEKLATEVDIFLSKEMDNREQYLAMGANFHWLPQDFAPNLLEPIEGVEQDIEVLFTGTYLPHAVERNRLLKAIDEKYHLKICSITPVDWKKAGFKDVMDVMIDKDLAKMVARAKINISIDHILKEGYWSDRNAQIMVCAGFVLFRYVPMSEIVFGPWISYFHTEKQMFELIDRYLANDELRHMWAWNGQVYARNNLLVGNRVYQMLNIVEDYNARKQNGTN